jgi:hypothetical protein
MFAIGGIWNVMKTKSSFGTQRFQFKPFEDETHLECICRLQLRGQDVGAYLLKNGQKFSFVFGFKVPGIHTMLSPEQTEAALRRLEEGLKGFRPGDRLRIHLRSFADDSDRWQELRDLADDSDCLETKFLLFAQQRTVRELTLAGDRQNKQIYLFATYTIEPGKESGSDQLEKMMAWAIERYETLKGTKDEQEYWKYQKMLTHAFTDGYQHWERLINARMSLQAVPMGADALWTYAWHQFNISDAPPLPQCLTLREIDGKPVLEEVVQEDLHASSRMICGEDGLPSHPKADRQWVRVRRRFVGALVLESKPKGFASSEHQLYYLWQALCGVPDCEVVCEVAAADRMMARLTLQRLTRQNLTATYRAAEYRNVDVASQIRAKRGVEAQEKIFEGALPIWMSVMVLVHRDTPSSLDEACQTVTHAFPQGEFIRETEVAWSLWLKSLPIVEGWLLGDDRKQMYLTNEAPGLLPLACNRAVDRRGLELITLDGKMPIHLDFMNQHRGILILGTTRSSKSVTVADIAMTAIAHNMNVIALDYPKPDGTTTYTDLVRFFGDKGAYFDIGSERNNLFQIPDLRYLPDRQREERLDDYKEFLVKALDTMVMGVETEGQLGKRVHTILWQALSAFFATLQIRQRYDAAFQQGFGSAAWQEMPTLVDFVEVVRGLDLGVDSESSREAIATIILELQGWLTSRVGKAISQPSTIRTDAKMTVFALRNVGDNIEAAVLALSAQSMAFRRALEVTDSLLIIDESPILFKYNGIAQIIGQVCANGAKSGIRPLITGQDPDTIANSIAGSQILQNLNTRLIGAIQPNAIASYQKIFNYDPEILLPNTDESFRVNSSRLCSHWLVDADARMVRCSHHPSAELLAAVANNPKEQRARQRTLAQFSCKFRGYKAFADRYAEALRSGRSMETITPSESSLNTVRSSS